MPTKNENVVLSFAIVHLSILTIQRRLALSLHKDDTLYKEIYHFFLRNNIDQAYHVGLPLKETFHRNLPIV